MQSFELTPVLLKPRPHDCGWGEILNDPLYPDYAQESVASDRLRLGQVQVN